MFRRHQAILLCNALIYFTQPYLNSHFSGVPIRLIVGGSATSLSAAVGEPVGSVIIFATSNPITGLEQIGRIYYDSAPTGAVNPRQLISQQDQGKTFVVEASVYSSLFVASVLPLCTLFTKLRCFCFEVVSTLPLPVAWCFALTNMY